MVNNPITAKPETTSQLRIALEDDHRFSAAILFGSYAAGTERADSDIDVAVLMRDDAARQDLTKSFLATMGSLGIKLGRDVHLIDLECADPELQHIVFAKGQQLFDRSDGRLKQLIIAATIEYVDGDYLRRMMNAIVRNKLEKHRG